MIKLDGLETRSRTPIRRLNRKRTLTVGAHQREGTADGLFRAVRTNRSHRIAADMNEWGGEYEQANEANQKLMANVPVTMMLMFVISVMLFNSFLHPIILFLACPALIGVSAGLFIANLPLILPLLSFLGLVGMLIKNEIVLLEQVNIELGGGKPYQP